jgi:Protein of unknown function (DUF1553)/Protein of unknown function (DUF1549)/Planctomycete cytochrome C
MLKGTQQKRRVILTLLALAVTLQAHPPDAKKGTDSASSVILFEQQVLPILERSCVKCHAGSTPQAGLDVRSRASLLRGGAKGPAVVPNSPEKSLLFHRVRSGEMPLGGPPLSEMDLELIRQWIQQGASATHPEAASSSPPGADPRDRAHWAFQPPRCPPVPKVTHRKQVLSPIDAFLLAKLEERNLTFAPEADRVTLLRRVAFDLTGLPPSPQEVADFLADRSPKAYETVVDRLLASPHYGERWGRHWLDLAGYADSEGVLSADVVRPNAWRYRDYVIRAFNADKPYDRFLKEQIAGDELSDYRKHDKFPPEVVPMLEATGFLRTAVDATREDFEPVDYAEYQWRTLFDTQQIVVSSVLGLTIHCARCHDHKYEPLSQRDYYRLLAFFQGAIRPNGPVLPSDKRAIVEATREEKAAAAEINGPLDMVIKALGDLKTARAQQFRARHPDGEQASDEDLRKTFPEYSKLADQLANEIKEEDARRTKFQTIRALYDLDATPPPANVLERGDPLSPGEELKPGVPAVLDDPVHPFQPPPPDAKGMTTGRRSALAEWLTRPENPLTARVMVNHLWAHHFGEGLVPTAENFGKSGLPPSNQPLLDWLATEFVRQGWSIKAMHRLILTSAAYRQSSRARPEGLDVDPENKLLWRRTPRRLEAEIVRDAVLKTAGTLDAKMYGEPVKTKVKPSGEIVPVDETQPGRRSIYQLARRSALPTFLEVFDAPIMETNCTRRPVSISASQALALMNSEFVGAQAEHFARRVLAEVPSATAQSVPAGPKTIAHAVRLAFSREPSAHEMDLMLSFVSKQAARYPKLSGQELALQVTADLCLTLFSANEFIYVD